MDRRARPSPRRALRGALLRRRGRGPLHGWEGESFRVSPERRGADGPLRGEGVWTLLADRLDGEPRDPREFSSLVPGAPTV